MAKPRKKSGPAATSAAAGNQKPKAATAPPARSPAPKAGAHRAAPPAAKPKARAKERTEAAPAAAPKPQPEAARAPKPAKKRSDLSERIVHMIAEEMAIEEAELTPSASLKEDLNLDPVDVAELLMQAEAAFDLHPFSDQDWESCETVNDFVELVQKRADARRAKKPGAKAGKA